MTRPPRRRTARPPLQNRRCGRVSRPGHGTGPEVSSQHQETSGPAECRGRETAKVCGEVASAIDLLPTFAKLIGAELPKHTIDGKDIGPLLFGEPGAKSPHEAFFFYVGSELHAVRSGDWKLHFPHDYLTVAGPTRDDGKPANYENLTPQDITRSGVRGIASRHGYRVEKTPLALYNLRDDMGESKNVAADHPEVVRRLQALADRMRADLGDELTGRAGKGVRPVGRE